MVRDKSARFQVGWAKRPARGDQWCDEQQLTGWRATMCHEVNASKFGQVIKLRGRDGERE